MTESGDHFDHTDRAETNRPLNSPAKRGTVGPALAVVALVVVVLAVFALLTFL